MTEEQALEFGSSFDEEWSVYHPANRLLSLSGFQKLHKVVYFQPAFIFNHPSYD